MSDKIMWVRVMDKFFDVGKIVILLVFVLSLFLHIQLIFHNHYDNGILYEKLTLGEPYETNIRGLLPSANLRFTYSFSENAVVMQGGKPMKKVEFRDLQKSPDGSYCEAGKRLGFTASTLSKGPVVIYTPRPVNNLFSVRNVLVLLIAFLLLQNIYEFILSRKHILFTPRGIRYFYIFLILVPILMTVGLIREYPLLTGGQSDAGGYVGMSFNTIEEIAGTLRTPGYPVFLRLMRNFSPMGLFSTYVFQALIYFSGISYLVFSLFRLGMNRYLGLLLLLLFQRYFYDYHSAVLADSLSLSGIILLIACSIHYAQCCVEHQNAAKRIALLCGVGTICFVQLMIKPFPTTILIAPILFFCIGFRAIPFKKMVKGIVVCVLICLIPAVAYCSYRYYRYDNFNFASFVNVSLVMHSIVLCDEAILRDESVSHDTRKMLNLLIDDHNRTFPDKKWPMVIDNSFSTYLYAQYVNYFWFRSNYAVYVSRNVPKKKEYTMYVFIDNASKPYAKELVPKVPLARRYAVMKRYLSEVCKLGDGYKYYPNVFYPLRSRIQFAWMIVIPAVLLAIFKLLGLLFRRPAYFADTFHFRIAGLLLVLTFIVPFCFLASCLLVAPFCEIRRELVGLWAWFFGWTALGLYLCWSVLLLSGKWLIAGGRSGIERFRSAKTRKGHSPE